MRRDRKLATAAGAMMLAMLTPLPPVQAQEREQEPIRACVPSGFGDTTNIIMRMEAHGWTVNDEPYLELNAENPYAAFDVIWIAWNTSKEALTYLRDPSGELRNFTKDGGVLVMLDPSGTAWGLDLAPGGVDVLSLPPGGAGSVTVSAVDHALITGVGTGGVQLTATDLDPEATGGLGYLSNFPSRATTIAENAAGPVLLEYAEGPDNVEGDGRVVVGVLPDPSVNVIDNIVRYVESLVP